MSPIRLLAAASLAFAATTASAAPLTVSASGTWAASVPASFFTAPGQTWSFSYQVDSNPTLVPEPDFSVPGLFTTPVFTGFEFRLGGVLIPEVARFATFYNAGNGGGLDIYFNDQSDPLSLVTALSFYGPQMYSGSELDPTILPGSYDTFGPPSGGFLIFIEGVRFDLGAETVVIAAVPAPGSAALAGVALLALCAARRRALAAARH